MIYYVETNLITIIIAALMLIQGREATSKRETSHLLFNTMLYGLIIFCISDIVAFLSKGVNPIGVQIANIIYFILMAFGAYIWYLYISVRLGYTVNLKRTMIISAIPMLGLIASILFNPITQFYFSVDSEFFYHRGPGLYLCWIVEWGYVFAALYLNVKGFLKEKSMYKKAEYKGYLYFMLPLSLSAICQMAFYGTTVTQVGYVIALLMVNMNWQNKQIQKDELTGLNNKNAFLRYKDVVVSRNEEVTVFMIDVDRFKHINDTYGHLVGDKVLKDIASILDVSVEATQAFNLSVYRYAGDEFIIIGLGISQTVIRRTSQYIQENLDLLNQKNKEYTLTLSIGISTRKCDSMHSLNQLIDEADRKMYGEKIKHRN